MYAYEFPDSEAEDAGLRGPVERRVGADRTLEGQVLRQGGVEDPGLNPRAEEGEGRAGACEAFILSLAPGDPSKGVPVRSLAVQRCVRARLRRLALSGAGLTAPETNRASTPRRRICSVGVTGARCGVVTIL